MHRLLSALAIALLCSTAQAGIDCYPAEAGGVSPIKTVYVGGTRAFALAWLCGSTWSWVAIRATGPDVRWHDAIGAIAALQMMNSLHLAEPAFMLGELQAHLPQPHN